MARRKRTKRSNPFGFGDLGIEPFTMAIGAATAASALLPSIIGLFSKAPETPSFRFDPNKYSQDYAAQLAAQTQQVLAQQQTKQKEAEAKAIVQAAEAKSEGNTKLLIYGILGIAGVVGVAVLINSLRKRK